MRSASQSKRFLPGYIVVGRGFFGDPVFSISVFLFTLFYPAFTKISQRDSLHGRIYCIWAHTGPRLTCISQFRVH